MSIDDYFDNLEFLVYTFVHNIFLYVKDILEYIE